MESFNLEHQRQIDSLQLLESQFRRFNQTIKSVKWNPQEIRSPAKYTCETPHLVEPVQEVR